MGGDIEKNFNPNYYDQDDHIKKNVDRSNYYKALIEDPRAVKIPVNINGVQYESLKEASDKVGCSVQTIRRHLKKLNKSKLSELQVDTVIKKTLVFKKVK